MPYPAVLDNVPQTANDTTNADELTFNGIIDALNRTQAYLGLQGEPASMAGGASISAKIAALLAAPGGIAIAATPPLGPAVGALWLDSDANWPLTVWDGLAWDPVGADARSLQGRALDATAPAPGAVLVWDDLAAHWTAGTGAVGLTNPMTAVGDLIVGGAGGAATRLGLGSAGQVLASSGSALVWQTPNYIANPAGGAAGALLVADASAIWTALVPGPTGYALTSNGTGAVPTWQAIPTTPPGSGIPAPSGLRIGSLLQYDGSAFIAVTPGAAGTVLTAHGDTNTAPALLTWAAPPGGMANPMTQLADLIVGLGGGAPARLGIGGNGTVLTVVAGAPAWAAVPAGFTNPMTTLDDLIVGGASGVAGRLGKGANGYVLQINSSGHVAWAANPAGFADPLTTRGDLLVRGASGTTRLALGTTSYVLTSDGTDAVWSAAATGLTNPMTTQDDLILGGAAGVPARLGKGSDGQVLTVDPTTHHLLWATPAAGGGTSRIALTTTGLLYYINFLNYPDQVLPNAASGSAGPDGWYVHNTADQGTWELVNGLLMPTSNGTMDRCRRDSATWLNAVYEYGMWHSASLHVGGRQAVGAGADYDQLIRNQEWQCDYGVGGTYGQNISTGAVVRTPLTQYSRYRQRINWTGANRLLSNWENRRARLSGFSSGQGPTVAGGIGAIAYQATLAVGLTDYAVLSDTTLSLGGLGGTDGFRVYDWRGMLIGSSGAQSSGVATLDLSPNGVNALCDFPLYGYLVAYSDQGTWATPKAGGRFPAEGKVVLWGGSTFTYT